MSITPIHCPDSGCWSAFGIPDAYTEARAYRLAAHRAEEHGEPLTAEQIAYATRVGHPLPSVPALPAPVGDQPQPLHDQRLAEIDARAAHLYEYTQQTGEGDTLAGEDVPALLAEVQRLKAELVAAKATALNEAADEVVASCPDHGPRDEAWMDCHCDVAFELRQWAKPTTNQAGEVS